MASQDFTLLVGTKIDDSQVLQQLNTISKKTSVTVKVNADTSSIESLKTVTTKGTDSMGNLVTATEKFNKSGESLGTVVSSVTQKMDNASKSTKSLAADFVDTTAKVAKFGASTAVIGVFYSAIQEAKEAILDFNSALTEFTKVSDLSDEQLSSYIDKLGELGEVTGRSQTQMLEAATEFKKTGATEEDAAQLAQLATLYQNVADSEITAGESASYITSQMKAFNITADDAVSILDKTNEVSNRFAVSSTDISSALTKTSGAMATYGNTIDETIGLTVAGTEILTGQAGKVSRGLRSVGAEIVKLADETGQFSYQVDGATKTLSLFDEQGKMLSTFDVLSKLAEDWNQMTEAEQSNVALTIGMKTQIDVLSATLMNFDSALEATEVAQNSAGSAMKENEAYMESLAA